jgi:hypothetical protein
MQGDMSSLNVSVAKGVTLFEAVRHKPAMVGQVGNINGNTIVVPNPHYPIATPSSASRLPIVMMKSNAPTAN